MERYWVWKAYSWRAEKPSVRQQVSSAARTQKNENFPVILKGSDCWQILFSCSLLGNREIRKNKCQDFFKRKLIEGEKCLWNYSYFSLCLIFSYLFLCYYFWLLKNMHKDLQVYSIYIYREYLKISSSKPAKHTWDS